MTAKKALLQLVAKWRKDHNGILNCAQRNKRDGDSNAHRQLKAQAFGVQVCTDELDALRREVRLDE